ncbi:hypothetical protein EDB89DRAFT_1901120 [Lactarius sanguifluus]|nr:hypothetical protein EDB89DRAFT_1901120 [Lactarius sanguifluus]
MLLTKAATSAKFCIALLEGWLEPVPTDMAPLPVGNNGQCTAVALYRWRLHQPSWSKQHCRLTTASATGIIDVVAMVLALHLRPGRQSGLCWVHGPGDCRFVCWSASHMHSQRSAPAINNDRPRAHGNDSDTVHLPDATAAHRQQGSYNNNKDAIDSVNGDGNDNSKKINNNDYDYDYDDYDDDDDDYNNGNDNTTQRVGQRQQQLRQRQQRLQQQQQQRDTTSWTASTFLLHHTHTSVATSCSRLQLVGERAVISTTATAPHVAGPQLQPKIQLFVVAVQLGSGFFPVPATGPENTNLCQVLRHTEECMTSSDHL